MPDENRISRREFLKETAAVSAGIATASVLGAWTPAAAAPIPDKWDKEADVVVVGFGGAGGAAAWEALKAGASTIVLERMKTGGGSTNICGGVTMLGGGTPLQKALGFSNDTRDNMSKYFMAAAGHGADAATIGVFCDKSLELYDWMTKTIGIKFTQKFQDQWPAERVPDYGLSYSGDELQADYAAIATPVPRGHTTMAIPDDGTTHSGSGIFQPLQAAVVKAGAQILYEALSQSLVFDPKMGRVLGVVAKYQGKDILVRANRGVILTAGGFAFNKDMVAMYCPGFNGVSPLGTSGDDGSGIKMGQAIGADVSNMGYAFAAGPLGTSTPKAQGILVNQRGQRYMAEDHYLAWSGIAIAETHHPSYLIVDGDVFKSITPAPAASGIVAQANTIQELAAALKTAPGVLENTVAFYNQGAANGQDPLFAKLKKYVVPLTTPPFYALAATASSIFTHGGLRINVKAQVLDTAAAPIGSLYAAGRNAANVVAQNYQGSGTAVASALIFGRIAGQNAAAEKPWGVA